MGLSLREVAPLQGSLWLRHGVTTFFRQPLRFALLFLAYLGLFSLLGSIPLAGPVLAIATIPLLSLAFMLATRDVLAGQRLQLSHLFALVREPKPARRAMLLLCAGFGIVAALIVAGVMYAGGDELTQAMKPMADPDRTMQQTMEMVANPHFSRAVNIISVLMALLSVPYWHALALVHWGGQSAGQALFSSTLALWRTKGAFMVYGLAWLGCVMAASLLTAVGAALLAALAGAALSFVLGAGIFIALSAAFYVSLWFMFADSFATNGQAEAAAPPD